MANTYGYSLHEDHENDTLAKTLDRKFPSSAFYRKGQYVLQHNNPLSKKREIEKSVLKIVQNATKEIRIIQPYHYPMYSFDKAMI